MIAKCPCQHCGTHIEFATEEFFVRQFQSLVRRVEKRRLCMSARKPNRTRQDLGLPGSGYRQSSRTQHRLARFRVAPDFFDSILPGI